MRRIKRHICYAELCNNAHEVGGSLQLCIRFHDKVLPAVRTISARRQGSSCDPLSSPEETKKLRISLPHADHVPIRQDMREAEKRGDDQPPWLGAGHKRQCSGKEAIPCPMMMRVTCKVSKASITTLQHKQARQSSRGRGGKRHV